MSNGPSIFDNDAPAIAPDVMFALYIGKREGKLVAKRVTNPVSYDGLRRDLRIAVYRGVVEALQVLAAEEFGPDVSIEPTAPLAEWVQT